MEAVPTPSRTIFIGDVHGMLDTLDQLLAELKLTATDRLIFLGDLIDKGPDPVGVIRRVAELQARGPAETHVLRGNHEDNHLRFRRNLTERPGIAQAMADSKPVLDEFFTQSSRADWNVLDNTLPFWHCPDLNILAVHGGIPGNMETFPCRFPIWNGAVPHPSIQKRLGRTKTSPHTECEGPGLFSLLDS